MLVDNLENANLDTIVLLQLCNVLILLEIQNQTQTIVSSYNTDTTQTLISIITVTLLEILDQHLNVTNTMSYQYRPTLENDEEHIWTK